MGLLMISMFLVGFEEGDVPDVIQAHSFEVLNSKDQRVVRLSPIECCGGAIQTYSPGGKLLVAVGVNELGAGVLQTHNLEGKKLVRLSAKEDGSGLVGTFDNKGQLKVID